MHVRRYMYTLYPVNAGLSIKVNVRFVTLFPRYSLSQMRDEWLSGVPTTPTNTRYRPFSRLYTAVYGGPHVRLYTHAKLVDINMGNWTTGIIGNRKDMLAKGRTGVCPVANIEGG